ncbi:hypothetical protein DERP_005274 [Dermatophagoides pteronyssinus]|uniref:Uncharacterized protein n=1 Tax=Dermatophagoides pteronyssinus TaxID=6956 RepID=A0ABQ8JMQ6_DERPT|nr:hypothetical protein DERP_005274 [Dermatophagoides pteronyssinus]
MSKVRKKCSSNDNIISKFDKTGLYDDDDDDDDDKKEMKEKISKRKGAPIVNQLSFNLIFEGFDIGLVVGDNLT